MNSEYREPIISRAIDVLRERGWSSFGAHGPRGEVCVAIAINTVLDEMRTAGELPSHCFTEAAQDAHLAVMKVASDEVGHTFGAIHVWNDDYCRSADEAIDAMKRAVDIELPPLVKLGV